MAKETAEQKLLKALQKKTGTPASVVKKADVKKGFNFSISIFDLNRILFVVICLCLVGLFLQLKSGSVFLSQEYKTVKPKEVFSSDKNDFLKIKSEVKFYLNSFSNRNIFKPYDISLGKTASAHPNLAKRLSKFKLVGVAWLDLPQSAAIMIEDTQLKTTYFLKSGEKLEDVTVKTIYTDRVVLSYENEETIIKL